MTIRRLIYLFIATACLLLQTACQFEDDGQCADTINVGDSYISLTVAVSNGDTHARTRANTPAGGEDGDGREAGFERENTVTGITLILYQDANGINTAGNPKLDLVRYFPVTERAAGESPIEVTYTTGSQPLGRHNLNLSATYHAIVIANAPGVAASLTEGVSTLSNIKDATLNTIYAGDPTNSAADCTHFVMSSESDCTINFGSVTAKNLDGTAHTKGQDMLYDLTDTPIIIERMAARIDFWSANSNGYKTSENNAAYTIPGYEYPVVGSATDRFVVTGIVPFNLVNGHATYGKEYLLKRIRIDIDDASTTSRLADETTGSYVIDPMTTSKLTAETPTLTSSLESVYSLIRGDEGKSFESSTDNPFYHSIASMHESATAIDNKENVVVCYPMENTLLPSASKLYYHATGIAIVGYYYQGGTGTGKRYVYLGYMRHQGNAASYDVSPSTSPLGTTDMMPNSPAMNFGVVRNNIYRVSINSVTITPDAPRLKIKIEEEKWRHVDNPIIYI